jgi:hypothetical protein
VLIQAPLALSLSTDIKSLGEYAGFAAVIGLALLATLYFAQARELKRLGEWAAREATRPRAPAPGPRAPAPAPPPTPSPSAPIPAVAAAVAPVVEPAQRPVGPIVASAVPGVRRVKIPSAGDAARIAPSTPAAALPPSEPASPETNTLPPTPAGEPLGDAVAAPPPQAVPLVAAPAPTRVVEPAPTDNDFASEDPEATAGDAQRSRRPPAPNAPVAVAAAAAVPGLDTPAALAPPTVVTPRVPRRRGEGAAQPAEALADSPARRRRASAAPTRANRWPRYVAVIGVALIVIAVIVLNSGGSGAPTPGAGGGPAPASITVAVLNATNATGIAKRVADQLGKAGFVKGVVADAGTSAATTVVGYSPSDRKDAIEVEQQLGLGLNAVRPVSTGSLAAASGAGSRPQVVITLGANYNQ